MKRIVLLTVLSALLGINLSAFAGGPETPKAEPRSLYEKVFNTEDLDHHF